LNKMHQKNDDSTDKGAKFRHLTNISD